MRNKPGSPVEGSDFFGRKREIERALDILKNGNSIILAAPRRVGKSSFSKKLLEKVKEKGWKTLYLDLEMVKTEEAFVKLFIEKLQEEDWWETGKARLGELFEKLKLRVGYGDASVSIEWKTQRDDIFRELRNVLEHDKDMLIVVDELAVFLTYLIKEEGNNENARYFLDWLRGQRQVTGTRVRWIFCSSIGIRNFTNMNNLSYTLNDVETFPLDEFSRDEAELLIKALAASEKITTFGEELIDFMLEKLEWNLPYFIQVIFSRILRLHVVSGQAISKEIIDNAYTELIEGDELNTWDERLGEYAEMEPYARLVLKRLCQNKQGESRETLFNAIYQKINDEEKTDDIVAKIIKMLMRDGYIIVKERSYLFRSPLLRDYWYNRFVR